MAKQARVRWLALVVACLGGWALGMAPLATAQAPPVTASPPPAAEAAGMVDARAVARVLFRESDLVTLTLEALTTQMMPELRDGLAAAPNFKALPAATKARVMAVFETMPAVFGAELVAAVPDMETACAREFSALFTPAELTDISHYFTSPGGVVFVRKAMGAGVRAGVASETTGASEEGLKAEAVGSVLREMTGAELADMMTFAATPGGRAFGAKSQVLGATLKTAVEATLMARMPTMMARLQQDLCEAFGPAACASMLGGRT